MTGWVKMPRDMVNWRWFKNANVFRTFMYLVFTANYEPRGFENITVERGQTVTSYPQLSNALGITEAQARTAVKNLKETGDITVRTTSKFSVVTIVNYDLFQDVGRQYNSQISDECQTNNSQITGSQQADNSQITALKEINKERSKENIPPLPPKGETIPKMEKSRKEDNSDDGFEIFWKAYPRKEKKPYALKAWKKLKPDKDTLAAMLEAIERKKQSEQWRKDNGQYIPHPATWLNGRCWEDTEEPLPPPQPTYEFDPENPYKDWR